MKRIIQIVVLLLSLHLWAQNNSKPPISSLSMAQMQLNENHPHYNPYKGFESCKKAAEVDVNPKAMNILAILYSDGVGTTANQEQALYWFEKAAEAGYSNAWYNVGTMYRLGRGTTQNFEKAYECFSIGTEKGSASSMYGKGYMLYKGFGCEQNYGQAFELFKVSSNRGAVGSMYMLGLCYRNGYGVEKDLVEAKKHLTEAVNYGYQFAKDEMMEAEPEFANYKKTLKSYSKGKEIHNAAIKDKFQPVQHRIKSAEELDGTYSGYLVTYDWSGQHIIDKDELTVDLKLQGDGTFTGIWTENDKTVVNLKGTITETEVLFDNTAYSKAEHYSAKKPTDFLFKEARLQNIIYKDSAYLAGNIQLWSINRNEPEKPMYISLVKKNKNVVDTKTTLVNDDWVVYPNPFTNSFSFNLSLNEQSTVTIALHSLTGTVLYTEKLALPAGNHSHTITVNVPSGAYLLKVDYGNKHKSTIVIKS